MTTKHTPATPLPHQVAQYQKAGRGFLITRNSATLADTDYEHVAKEIVDALNNKRHAYPKLVAALRRAREALIKDGHRSGLSAPLVECIDPLLRELGEE